jgi:hypothetical protein
MTADKGYISRPLGRLWIFRSLGAIMDIPIDTPLLCGKVVHYSGKMQI